MKKLNEEWAWLRSCWGVCIYEKSKNEFENYEAVTVWLCCIPLFHFSTYKRNGPYIYACVEFLVIKLQNFSMGKKTNFLYLRICVFFSKIDLTLCFSFTHMPYPSTHASQPFASWLKEFKQFGSQNLTRVKYSHEFKKHQVSKIWRKKH